MPQAEPERPGDTPPRLLIKYDGRFPGSRIVIVCQPSQATPSGMNSKQLRAYSCGGSPGIGVKHGFSPHRIPFDIRRGIAPS